MYRLLLDTSTKTLYCALVDDNKILSEYYIEGRNDHAKNVVSIIDKTLKENNLSINDLNEIYAGVGPGSYTGVRMAVTVAKMIATNTKIKLFGFSSLEMMVSGYSGKVLAYIDARRGNSFNALYNDGELEGDEALRETEGFISTNKDYMPINEDMIKVDPFKVIKNSKEVLDPHGFAPNYLRETEAERNLLKW